MPTTEVQERLAAIQPAFARIQSGSFILTADLKQQAKTGVVFALELDTLEAIAGRIFELEEICRQNALVAE